MFKAKQEPDVKSEVQFGLPLVNPKSVDMSSERLARIKSAMMQFVEQKRVPGFITTFVRQGKLPHLPWAFLMSGV